MPLMCTNAQNKVRVVMYNEEYDRDKASFDTEGVEVKVRVGSNVSVHARLRVEIRASVTEGSRKRYR